MKRTIGGILLAGVLGITTFGPSASATAGTRPPKHRVPSLTEVVKALDSTGIKLCDLSNPDTPHEHIYAWCSGKPRSGLTYVYVENSRAEALSDVQSVATGNGGSWIMGPVGVYAQLPYPGTNRALGRLGFKRLT